MKPVEYLTPIYNYLQVAANDALRANLVNSIVAFTKEHGLDGFDIDWEYPAQRGGAIADKVINTF